ncbi:MAG: NAD(P)-dependent oxidoreductase [Pedosphaera sp.]|nr:NAD(P)-dependent oxidoreductase [Pedosphaera sp.]
MIADSSHQKILITGGTGFLGSHLMRRWVASGLGVFFWASRR